MGWRCILDLDSVHNKLRSLKNNSQHVDSGFMYLARLGQPTLSKRSRIIACIL